MKKNVAKKFLLLIFFIVFFVFLFSFYKIFYQKPTYIFTKIKVSQGFWWAQTAKPPFWYLKGFENLIKNNEKEYDLSGNLQSEIIEYRVYPSKIANQYDIFLTMKLKVAKLNHLNKYSFKRSAIGISAPVDFEFPSLQFSGTIIDISEKPFSEKYQEKIFYLVKPFAYDFEYDSIKINDKYYDGKENVVEILDKQILNDEKWLINNYNNINFGKNILIKAKFKIKKENNNYIFAEEQIIKPGAPVFFETTNFRFENYLVNKIE